MSEYSPPTYHTSWGFSYHSAQESSIPEAMRGPFGYIGQTSMLFIVTRWQWEVTAPVMFTTSVLPYFHFASNSRHSLLIRTLSKQLAYCTNEEQCNLSFFCSHCPLLQLFVLIACVCVSCTKSLTCDDQGGWSLVHKMWLVSGVRLCQTFHWLLLCWVQ